MSILNKLINDRVFSTTLSDDKRTIELLELCDDNFSSVLSKGDLEALIDELKLIHNEMKE